MLKLNLLSRFFFAGVGFCMFVALPVLIGTEAASQFFTVVMALNLFSGWFSLSFRQQLYIDIQKSDKGELPAPTLRKNVVAKGGTFAMLVLSALIVPFVVPGVGPYQGEFFIGIVAAYLLSFSYVSLWYSGRLYFSYALDAAITIILFAAFVLTGEENFTLGFVLLFFVAVAVFVRVGFRQWVTTGRSGNTVASQLLSQLIAVASFAEVTLFAGIALPADIVTYRITLSFVNVLGIIFSVFRQWQIFKDLIVPKRQRTLSTFAAALAVIAAGAVAYMIYPPALFLLLLLAALVQLIAAPDQFLVIRDNRSLALVIGYVVALSISFGGALLLGVTDLNSLLMFKIVLIGTTSLVPTSIVLLLGIREDRT